eukprot:gene16805-23004_t
MGNKLSGDIEHHNKSDSVDTNYMTGDERMYLKSVYNRIFKQNNNSEIKVNTNVTNEETRNGNTKNTKKENEYIMKDNHVKSDHNKIQLNIENVHLVFGESKDPKRNHNFEFFSQIMFVGLLQSNISTFAQFEQYIVDFTRISSAKTLTMLWNIIMSYHEIVAEKKLEYFFHILLTLSQPIQQEWEDEDNHDNNENNEIELKFAEFFRTMNNLSSTVDFDFSVLINWSNNYCPHLYKILETHLSIICFQSNLSLSYRPYQCPFLNEKSAVVSVKEIISLSLYNINLQGSWKKLYTTEKDGLSFNRIVHHVLGYKGPTCLLIKCRDEAGTVLGAYTNDHWKDQNRFFGSGSNILFTIHPRIRIYRSKASSNGSYQWLNTKSYGLPHGMGFGGSAEGTGFRLFIPDTLEHCVARSSCPTYESGLLVREANFEIDYLEIWGCGGDEIVLGGLKAQAKEREIVDENIRKARQVDKAQFFNNEFDNEFLLSNTMSHNKNKENR